MIGKTISHYRILKKIGRGGMGVVYQAEDTRLRRPVALKFLPPDLTRDEEAKKRFIREAQAASALDHPNICTIYEIDETKDGQSYIAMACYSGQTLKDKINDERKKTEEHGAFPIPGMQNISIAIQIAKGLARAHQAGMIHRDIKPANIMLTEQDEVKILDFGLAKLSGQTTLTKAGVTPGTVAYMSPEQLKGESVDHRTDIWSFGVLLYELFTGELPFKGDYDQAVLYSILNEDPLPLTAVNPQLPVYLEEIVQNCLQKNPEQRYQNATDIVKGLQQSQNQFSQLPSARIGKIGFSIKKFRRGIILTVFFFIAMLAFILIPSTQLFVKELLGFRILPAEIHMAVLPCTNIGNDPENQALCDGFVEILTSNLTQLEKYHGKLWIVPYSEIRKNKIISVQEAKKMYSVNLAVTSGYQEKQDQIILSMNLVDARNLRQLQSDIIRLNRSNFNLLQRQAIQKLSNMLEIQLDPKEEQSVGGKMTTEHQAYFNYLQARGYLQNYDKLENIEKAITLFEASIEHDPKYALAYAGLGEAYWRKYRHDADIRWIDQALYNCDRALQLDDQKAAHYVTLGIIQNERGQYLKAVHFLQKALTLDSLCTDAYRELARTYQSQGEFSLAEKAFQKAIKHRPFYWGNYSVLGNFYYRQGRYQEAVQQYKKVLDIVPNNVMALRNLGGLYFYLEEWDKAQEMFERSLQIEPTYPAYSNLGALLFYQHRFREAAEMYRKALDISNKNYVVWAGLAEAYRWQEQKFESAADCYKEAIHRAEEQLKVNPNDTGILADLCGYYATVGKQSQARDLLAKILNRKPNDVEIYFRIGETFELLGEREKALDWIEKALTNGFSKTMIDAYPGLAELRSDGRYQNLIKKMKKP